MSGLQVDISGRVGTFGIFAQFSTGGGVTALFGPSGAGKTTILKMIAGTARPDTGRIVAGSRTLFDSEASIDLPPQARGVGFVFQEGRLFPHLTVRRNLTYARWAGGRSGSRTLDEVVKLLGLEAHLDRHPGTLSGGERQRVAIGRALLADPELLLMDEPISSLDQTRRAEILPYLESVANETQIPILYVSHDIDEVTRLADRVVAIDQGTVGAIGTPAEILGRHRDVGENGDPISILEGHVTNIDSAYGTALIDTGGGMVELAEGELQVGERVRLRIHASDVAIATAPHGGLSIRNQLKSRIEKVERNGTSADVSLLFEGQRLLSRISAKSADTLRLTAGMAVIALFKAVSVERIR